MFRIETPSRLASRVRAGIVIRSQLVGNPCGVSLSPAGAHSPREVRLSRRVVASQLGRSPADLRFLHQVHGTRVVYRGDRQEISDASDTPAADAHWTDTPGIVLTASVADCCPVVVMDRDARVIGLAHAGWRGAAGAIVNALIDAILASDIGVSVSSLLCWIGPCAGGDRYEVGTDVAAQFSRWPEAIRPHHTDRGKAYLDIRTVLFQQLSDAGVPGEQIETSRGETIGDPRYHSFRRDRFASGRMLAFVTID